MLKRYLTAFWRLQNFVFGNPDPPTTKQKSMLNSLGISPAGTILQMVPK